MRTAKSNILIIRLMAVKNGVLFSPFNINDKTFLKWKRCYSPMKYTDETFFYGGIFCYSYDNWRKNVMGIGGHILNIATSVNHKVKASTFIGIIPKGTKYRHWQDEIETESFIILCRFNLLNLLIVSLLKNLIPCKLFSEIQI